MGYKYIGRIVAHLALKLLQRVTLISGLVLISGFFLARYYDISTDKLSEMATWIGLGCLGFSAFVFLLSLILQEFRNRSYPFGEINLDTSRRNVSKKHLSVNEQLSGLAILMCLSGSLIIVLAFCISKITSFTL